MLSESDEIKMKKLLLSYVEYQAKKNGCNMIIRNVHSDTNEYNDLKDNGYILTNEMSANDKKYSTKFTTNLTKFMEVFYNYLNDMSNLLLNWICGCTFLCQK
jgi:hypothetical protein